MKLREYLGSSIYNFFFIFAQDLKKEKKRKTLRNIGQVCALVLSGGFNFHLYGKETNNELPVQSSLMARLLHITECARLLLYLPYLNLNLLKYETALSTLMLSYETYLTPALRTQGRASRLSGHWASLKHFNCGVYTRKT